MRKKAGCATIETWRGAAKCAINRCTRPACRWSAYVVLELPLSFEPTRPPIEGETLATLELARLLVSRVYLGIGVPRGNGRPVLVLPGFLGGDEYLLPLRGWLRRIGYDARASGTLWNVGTPSTRLRQTIVRAEQIADERNQRLIVVGHSLGGIIARALAALRPDLVAHAITLGSPLNANPRAVSHPLVAQLGEVLLSEEGGKPANDAIEEALLLSPLPGDTRLTSLYSRCDAIVDWRACIPRDPLARAIEVHGTHCGLAWNEEVYRALGPLLASSAP
jgi:triacylglycerol lipase